MELVILVWLSVLSFAYVFLFGYRLGSMDEKIKALEEKVDEPEKIMGECYENEH